MGVYLKNKNLYNEIIKSKEQGELTENAKQMLILLANHTINKMSYKDQDDKNDCLQSGILALFANWHKFDPNQSSNAFAYYTEIFKRGIAAGFNELYKKKGDPESNHKLISIQSSNNGEGIFNL